MGEEEGWGGGEWTNDGEGFWRGIRVVELDVDAIVLER